MIPRPRAGTGDQETSTEYESSTEQTTLEDYRTAIVEAVTDTAMRRTVAADPDWSTDALDWIWRLPDGAEFTSDELRAALGGANASGAVIRRARQLGLIAAVGFTTSRFVQRHGGVIRVWRRLP